jgi:hypothetical protein
MIGLVVVFGIIALAFISLSSQQVSLTETHIEVTNLQHDRNFEKMTFEILHCQYLKTTNPVDSSNRTHVDYIGIRLNNTGSETVKLSSFMLYRQNPINVTEAKELWANNTKNDNSTYFLGPVKTGFGLPAIPSGTSKEFRIQDDAQISTAQVSDANRKNATTMMIVTDIGNKHVFQFNFTDKCRPAP